MLPRHVGKLLVLGAMLCAAGESQRAVPPAIPERTQASVQEDDITVLTVARLEALA